MKIIIHETEPAIQVSTTDELEKVLLKATEEAKGLNKNNIIFLQADNGNEMSVAVGGGETVLGFTYSHNNPPYYASKGSSKVEEPVFTGYVSLEHHTEYPRFNVIPYEEALLAIHEFYSSGELPGTIKWVEV